MNTLILAWIIAATMPLTTTATVTVIDRGTVEVAKCSFTSVALEEDSCEFDYSGKPHKVTVTYATEDAGVTITGRLMRKDGDETTSLGAPRITLAPNNSGELLQEGPGPLSIKVEARVIQPVEDD